MFSVIIGASYYFLLFYSKIFILCDLKVFTSLLFAGANIKISFSAACNIFSVVCKCYFLRCLQVYFSFSLRVVDMYFSCFLHYLKLR